MGAAASAATSSSSATGTPVPEYWYSRLQSWPLLSQFTEEELDYYKLKEAVNPNLVASLGQGGRIGPSGVYSPGMTQPRPRRRPRRHEALMAQRRGRTLPRRAHAELVPVRRLRASWRRPRSSAVRPRGGGSAVPALAALLRLCGSKMQQCPRACAAGAPRWLFIASDVT